MVFVVNGRDSTPSAKPDSGEQTQGQLIFDSRLGPSFSLRRAAQEAAHAQLPTSIPTQPKGDPRQAKRILISMYTNTYIHIYIYTLIHVYGERERERDGEGLIMYT